MTVPHTHGTHTVVTASAAAAASEWPQSGTSEVAMRDSDLGFWIRKMFWNALNAPVAAMHAHVAVRVAWRLGGLLLRALTRGSTRSLERTHDARCGRGRAEPCSAQQRPPVRKPTPRP